MQLCIVPKHRFVYPLAEKEIMANISKLIFGAAIIAASPALAQYAPQGDPSISVHHRKHPRIYNFSRQSASPAFAPVPPSVYDPGARPYVYVPGSAEGGD